MVGFQAFLGTFIGAALIHRYLGKNNPLIASKSVFLFMLLGGSVSLFIPPVISVWVGFYLFC